MAEALFLSQKYLTNNVPINANLDIEEVYKFARTAEDIYIHETIGSKLYDYLKGVVIASKASPPTSIGTNDATLLRHLRNALIWFTIYDALPFIHTKIRNIGVVKQNGDNIETADRSDVNTLRTECKNKGTFYMNIVKKYLCEYGNLYSEYKCDSWNLNPNKITAANCGISFERKIDIDYVKKWFNT
jgi:hypothetical protein